jgi:hypothetical protein
MMMMTSVYSNIILTHIPQTTKGGGKFSIQGVLLDMKVHQTSRLGENIRKVSNKVVIVQI